MYPHPLEGRGGGDLPPGKLSEVNPCFLPSVYDIFMAFLKAVFLCASFLLKANMEYLSNKCNTMCIPFHLGWDTFL